MKPGDRQFPLESGFTLIELLVVLTVIAILAGLLLPTLSRAKDKVRTIVCLHRQSQWLLAMEMYSSDHDDFIPREGYQPWGEVTTDNWTKVRDAQDVWYNALSKYAGASPASDYAAPEKRVSFYRKRNLIHCPSAVFPSQTRSAREQIALFSMAMNSQLIQYPNIPTIKFTWVKNRGASKVVLFLDNLLEGETKVHPAQEDSYLGQPAAFATRFSPRHRGYGNLAFADGHARTYRGSDVVETSDRSPWPGGPKLPEEEIVWRLNLGFQPIQW